MVHIDTISPELPRKGDVEITGTVTNVSDDTFTRINLHAFSSQDPILKLRRAPCRRPRWTRRSSSGRG